MPIRRRHLVVSTIGVLLLYLSCDSDRSSPLPTPGQPPPTPPAPAVVRLEIIGPSEIAPGESVQLIVNATKSDGSVEDVTAQSLFSPNTSPVLELTVRGLATGKANGQVFVNARFGTRNAGKTILVLPTGTFRLGGTVRESGFAIAGATVTVISGTGEGLTTTSNFGGFYALFGVNGPVRVQIKKDGYLNAIQQLDVTAHRTEDLNIVAERARDDLRGAYTLTVQAGTCASGASNLPAEMRRRQYVANVAQDGPLLTVTLEGADFIVINGRGRSFTGFLEVTNAIRFTIGEPSFYYYYYDGNFGIADRIGSMTLLVIGTAMTNVTGGRIAGPLEGSFLTSTRSGLPFGPFSARCNSTHSFEMVRQ